MQDMPLFRLLKCTSHPFVREDFKSDLLEFNYDCLIIESEQFSHEAQVFGGALACIPILKFQLYYHSVLYFR